jgi:D-3-phosphoglycerate dehydrogenase
VTVGGSARKWEGVELYEKTLGIIGLGRIGKLVAQRALAFGMRLVAFDPFVAAERARQLSVDLVDLDTLVEQSDFITIHVAKTPQTVGLLNTDLLKKAKPSFACCQRRSGRHRRRSGARRRDS